MHKIFKLCGSPSEEYWKKSKLPHATVFKPQYQYKRNIAETFRDFPSSAITLLDSLLAIEPKSRGTTASALGSEVSSNLVCFDHSYKFLFSAFIFVVVVMFCFLLSFLKIIS